MLGSMATPSQELGSEKFLRITGVFYHMVYSILREFLHWSTVTTGKWICQSYYGGLLG